LHQTLCSFSNSFVQNESEASMSAMQPDDDRRTAARERTYKAARIGFAGGRATTGCVVRNLSASGACLTVETPGDIPERFNLVFDSGEPCRVARRGLAQCDTDRRALRLNAGGHGRACRGHPRLSAAKTWMRGTSPRKTRRVSRSPSP
jgi:hypothetical protein